MFHEYSHKTYDDRIFNQITTAFMGTMIVITDLCLHLGTRRLISLLLFADDARYGYLFYIFLLTKKKNFHMMTINNIDFNIKGCNGILYFNNCNCSVQPSLDNSLYTHLLLILIYLLVQLSYSSIVYMVKSTAVTYSI